MYEIHVCICVCVCVCVYVCVCLSGAQTYTSCRPAVPPVNFCVPSFFPCVCVCAVRWEHLTQVAFFGLSRHELLHR